MFHSDAHHLQHMDSEVQASIDAELQRQRDGLELIASENYCSPAVMQAQGSILTNKYAEGYPKKRYYGGCAHVDTIETLALERVKKLFGARYANVQPHSGSQANMACYLAALKPGDKILGMDLNHGGHLTHGSKVNFSGQLFSSHFYEVNPESEALDYEYVLKRAQEVKPQMIIAGASAYSRIIDFAKFREIADAVGALLLVDMAHIAGLVATGLHPSPLPYADFVTSTTHKTLRGPRGGIILTNDEELALKINKKIFPGIQGGPLEHIIAAKAVAFKEALDPQFKIYQQQVIKNAQALATTLQDLGLSIVSGQTENHLISVKTDSVGLTGKESEALLEEIHITCNKNMIPGDTRSPMVTSGLRLGTPAVTTRGMKEEAMQQIAHFIYARLKSPQESPDQLRQQVQKLCEQFPLYL